MWGAVGGGWETKRAIRQEVPMRPGGGWASRNSTARVVTERQSTAPRRPLLHRGAAAQSSERTGRPSGAVNRRSRRMNYELG